MKKKIVTAVLILAVTVVCYFGIHYSQQRLNQQRLVYIEQSIQNACIQCYSVEGVYPVSIAYLEEHYGLMFDHDVYVVDYDCFASNQMPMIHVLQK